MTTTWIEPPPQRGMGCFAKGCLTVLVLIVFLAAALATGTYVGFRYLLTATHAKPITQTAAPADGAVSLKQRWEDFDHARDNHRPARVEFTADELNQLIASNEDLRGKAFVSIRDNVFDLAISAPLENLGFRDRFINAEIALQPPPDGDPRHFVIKKISLSGVDVSERVLNFIAGRHSLRSYVNEYSRDDEVTKVQLAGDRVILESVGAQ